jgi:hypothetical protein
MRKNKIIYSINIGDVQNVALQEYGRELINSELSIVADRIGDYFNWYEAIASVIGAHLIGRGVNKG